MRNSDPVYLTTVSAAFIQDWLSALENRSTPDALERLLNRVGQGYGTSRPDQRITLSEIARLYQLAAVETGDEMMGLWSRPIRARALQHLVTVLREASSLSSALYRFTTFWNLLLDDFRLELRNREERVELVLIPFSTQTRPQRFGHMLMLKLAHGLLSWLAGRELPVGGVGFAFRRPAFAADYAVIFPAPVRFNMAHTTIAFDLSRVDRPVKRSAAEASTFLQRAPLDWIFTGSREHLHGLRVRAFLYGTDWRHCQLRDAAEALNMTARTLIRRLNDEGTSFQEIKDALRRDMAISELHQGTRTIEEISHDTGFTAPTNFYRAFRKWTGRTPGSYRSFPLAGRQAE